MDILSTLLNTNDAISAIRDAVGEDLVIQATTEAVGIYTPDQQMDMVLTLQPEAVSLAIKELVLEGREEKAKEFFDELHALKVMPQFTLYSPEDIQRFEQLTREGVIPFKNPFLTFVLGRYSETQQPHPRDLLPFLAQ